MSVGSVLRFLVGRPLVRRAVDAGFAAYGRCRVARLDAMDTAAVQRATLLGLVRRARRTRFGREHAFDRVRTVADYQARVPLRCYEDFWQGYWQLAFPVLDDVTCPGRIPYFALSSGTTSGGTKYVPVSREMIASNQRAALTTLALFLSAHPGTPLFVGRMFFLGGSTDLRLLEGCGVRAGDLSGIAAREVRDCLRPFVFPPLEIALERDWEAKLAALVRDGARGRITLVGGVPSWLLVLFERLLEHTGRERVADVWPSLRLVVHGGTRFDPYRDRFRRLIGSDSVSFAEVYPASEGFVATEDPRYGFLRLVPDHDVFFEFVPVEDLVADRPARHTVAEVEPGVQYAVALTTCAGLWSYVVGDTVCFERRDPPLLRFTGRTRYSLSAFGEHLISEEVEQAVAEAARNSGLDVVDFHVGPVFAEQAGTPGWHRYLIEFADRPDGVSHFADRLDAELCRQNEDYAAHRAGDLTMLGPEVWPVRRGGFAAWMRSRGKLGGQHKLPRMDNDGNLTAEMSHWLTANGWVDRAINRLR